MTNHPTPLTEARAEEIIKAEERGSKVACVPCAVIGAGVLLVLQGIAVFIVGPLFEMAYRVF